MPFIISLLTYVIVSLTLSIKKLTINVNLNALNTKKYLILVLIRKKSSFAVALTQFLSEKTLLV